MFTRYTVEIEEFAERHFIKKFAKKHKKAWDITFIAIKRELQSFDVLLEKTIAEEVSDISRDIVICKTEFKIAGTKESRKTSGNRCILALCKEDRVIRILFVYHKEDLVGGGSETQNWKEVIKKNYREYKDLLI